MHRLTDDELREEMARLLIGVKSKWVAQQVGVSRQTIYAWRMGEGVTIDRLLEVAEAVGRPLRRDLKARLDAMADASDPEEKEPPAVASG